MVCIPTLEHGNEKTRKAIVENLAKIEYVQSSACKHPLEIWLSCLCVSLVCVANATGRRMQTGMLLYCSPQFQVSNFKFQAVNGYP